MPGGRQGGARRRSVAVVAGVRTPFALCDGAFRGQSVVHLGRMVCAELVARAGLDPSRIDALVLGAGSGGERFDNPARHVALAAGLPNGVDAWTCSGSSHIGLRALASMVAAIASGQVQVGVVCAVAAASDRVYGMSRGLSALLHSLGQRPLLQQVVAMGRLGRRDLMPRTLVPEARLSTPKTALAERLAQDFLIGKEEQDGYAMRSHLRGAAAWRDGLFDDTVMPAFVPFQPPLYQDDALIGACDDETMKLSPLLDVASGGTLSAGNSAPAADGAAALLLMRAGSARGEGLHPLGLVRAWSFAAGELQRDALLGQSLAIPQVLHRSNLRLRDVASVQMHVGSAVQAICVARRLESPSFCREVLGRGALGRIDPERCNRLGDSLAFGHAAGASDLRMVLQGLRDARQHGWENCLVASGEGDAQGGALILDLD